MEITVEKIKANDAALKKAKEDGVCVFDGKNVPLDSLTDAEKKVAMKGNILCDVYQLYEHKKHGLEDSAQVASKKMVEIDYALKMNEQYQTGNKLFFISEA